jgi:hypothetical protein
MRFLFKNIMDRIKQSKVRKWIDRLDENEKNAALAKMLDYAIDNKLMNIEESNESPYWLKDYIPLI